MKSNNPVVGMQVFYRPHEAERTYIDTDVFTATICRVIDKNTVNLSIIDENGLHFKKMFVKFYNSCASEGECYPQTHNIETFKQ